MHARDLIQSSLDNSERILNAYVGDLDPADLSRRPGPGMNPIAWQIGHLITSERRMVEGVQAGASPPLPEGFEAAHSKEAAASGDASGFLAREEYRRIWDAQRAATKAVLGDLTDEQLAATPANTMGGMCPTVGHVLHLAGAHALMHVGQFVPVRRQAGKPVVI